MRVGYVLKRYPRYSETFIVNEILAHESAGLEVEIFALRHPNDQHFQDSIARVRAPVRYLAATDLRTVRFWSELKEVSRQPGSAGFLESARRETAQEVYQAIRLAKVVTARGIDQLHAHFATSATTVARLAAHLADIPYSFTTHAKDIFHEDVDPEDYRRKLEEAAGVVTVSNYNRRYLLERYGQAASHVERIYNGMHLDRFSYESPLDRPRSIVAVGRLVEKKGFADLIEACAILTGRGYQFRCQIVGSGELRKELAARISSLGLNETVTLT
ncbi:MAG: glycosyltransferase, partial [Acidobacteriota bacterium]|nr:glycosyltransferase [Acidobacteriota bacterium]